MAYYIYLDSSYLSPICDANSKLKLMIIYSGYGVRLMIISGLCMHCQVGYKLYGRRAMVEGSGAEGRASECPFAGYVLKNLHNHEGKLAKKVVLSLLLVGQAKASCILPLMKLSFQSAASNLRKR